MSNKTDFKEVFIPPALPQVFECDNCDDYGLVYANVPVGHPQYGKIFPCPVCEKGAAIKQSRASKSIRNSGLPPEYLALTFDTFFALSTPERTGKNHAAGAAWLFASGGGAEFTLRQAANVVDVDKAFENDAPRSWLVLTGENGMGKTGLAAAVVNHLSLNSIPVLFVRVRELIRSVQESYGEDGNAVNQKLDVAQSIDYLVLDEFNLTNITPDRLEILETVVRGRHAKRLPTMATTNWTQAEFIQRWGMWIGDIMATAHWLKVAGVKLRNTSPGELESF